MAEQLSRADRRQVLARLDELRRETGEISTWLSQLDADKAAIILECAARDFGAACWDLEQAVRVRPVGWMATADGQQDVPRPYQR
jgi:predicted Fe-S protein YdhL (DUF1289 family)